MAQPEQHGWIATDDLLRLEELERAKDDSDPKALACYGMLVRRRPTHADQMLLRFVSGRPVSAVTCDFLSWCSARLAAQGVKGLFLVWDNASWHKSQHVRSWLRAHNREVKRSGQGVRIIPCLLPSKSPWLNPIEPKWVHGKRTVSTLVEANADREKMVPRFAIGSRCRRGAYIDGRCCCFLAFNLSLLCHLSISHARAKPRMAF